ncbi:hypothetical protein KCP70_20980 [Salmonella enterica subsp. enterica]|nr:hypothetical protein KCP70_20980 [Salmonella enterica subsp. enterica]
MPHAQICSRYLLPVWKRRSTDYHDGSGKLARRSETVDRPLLMERMHEHAAKFETEIIFDPHQQSGSAKSSVPSDR